MKKNTLEKDIQKKILSWLNKQPATIAVKYHSGMYSAGVSDILGCKDGKFFALEVKRPGEKPTDLQEIFLKRVCGCLGVGIAVDSLDKVKELWPSI